MTEPSGCGETPLDGDELDALLPRVRALLDDALTKAAVFDFEQAIQEQLSERLLYEVIDGELGLEELLTDHFVRRLHGWLYGEIWKWGGAIRQREINIGVAPERISEELRSTLDTLLYRWEHTRDWTPREFGMTVHAEVVRIHPFVDGNGRTTRLLADLVYVATQTDDVLFQYDWSLNKVRYIELLRAFDRSRDVRELAAFVPVRAVGR